MAFLEKGGGCRISLVGVYNIGIVMGDSRYVNAGVRRAPCMGGHSAGYCNVFIIDGRSRK